MKMDIPSQLSGDDNLNFSEAYTDKWILELVKQLIAGNSWGKNIKQQNRCQILKNFSGNNRNSNPAVFKITDFDTCIKMKISQENLLKFKSRLSTDFDSCPDWEQCILVLTKYQLNYSITRNPENSSVHIDIFFDVEDFFSHGIALMDIDYPGSTFAWCTEMLDIRLELLKASKHLGLSKSCICWNKPETSNNSNHRQVIVIDDDNDDVIMIDVDKNSTTELNSLVVEDDLKVVNENQVALDEIIEWKSNYCPPSSLSDIDSASTSSVEFKNTQEFDSTSDMLLKLMEDSENKEDLHLSSKNKVLHQSQSQLTESGSQKTNLNSKENKLGKKHSQNKENQQSIENIELERNAIPVCETEEMNENKDIGKASTCLRTSSQSECHKSEKQPQKQQSVHLLKRHKLIQNGIKGLVYPEEITKTLWNHLIEVHRKN